MANVRRRIGMNIRTHMIRSGISTDDFAQKLHYSVKDIWNILEGKALVPPMELDKIAYFLGTTKKELINENTDESIPELQYTKSFANPDNLDLILDLLDDYVGLKEMVC